MFTKATGLVLFLLLSGSAVGQNTQSAISNEIRIKVESGRSIPFSSGAVVCCKTSVSQFYFSRLFATVWDQSLASELIQVIDDCKYEGLNPDDYHLELLKTLFIKEDKTIIEEAEYELLLTDSFLLLATHMMSGKVDPTSIDSNWKVIRREGDPTNVLEQALMSRKVKEHLYNLRPKYKTYTRLMEKLSLYLYIMENGGWGMVDDGPALKKGMQDDRILSVRKRLKLTGDIGSYTIEDPDIFDDQLEEAIKKFQKRHGLAVDGTIGKGTLEAFNVSVEQRVRDIKINLERCRWLPQDLGENYIMVNIPAFEMEVVQRGDVMIEMDVAVGKPYRETPVFSSKMIYLVFNPYWTVPPTILANDIIPAQIKNPDYLKNTRIKVITGSGSEIDPTTIDWKAINPKQFPYQLRQEPGPNNALGEVKFIFPNQFNVYMHDTNHRELFTKSDRALSSGCIRLSKPSSLYHYLLVDNGNFTPERIAGILKTQQNYTVPLTISMMVHLQYWTAFIDENGILNFRKDVYSRNQRILNRLMEKPPLKN